MAISAPAICSRTSRRPQQAEFRHHRSATKCSGDEGGELVLLADFSARYSFTRASITVGFPTVRHGGSPCPDPAQPPGGCHPVSPALPFTRDLPSGADGAPVLIIDGERHSRRSSGDGVRLAEPLIRAAATVIHSTPGTGPPSADALWRPTGFRQRWYLVASGVLQRL